MPPSTSLEAARVPGQASVAGLDQLVAGHQPPNVLLVAGSDPDGMVGYTAIHPGDGETFLLFVHPAHAGRGIGHALLAAAHDALCGGGCTQAFLYVHERNARARAVLRPPGTARTVPTAHRTSAAPVCASCASSHSCELCSGFSVHTSSGQGAAERFKLAHPGD